MHVGHGALLRNWEPFKSQGYQIKTGKIIGCRWAFFKDCNLAFTGDCWCEFYGVEFDHRESSDLVFGLETQYQVDVMSAFESIDPGVNEKCKQVYLEVKHLTNLLGCDSVIGMSTLRGDVHRAGDEELVDDSAWSNKAFRFSKKGRQVLIRPFEEDRIPNQKERMWSDQGDSPERLIIDQNSESSENNS